jgi:acyl-CoA reductase-like NAD-dependent aldehyde dehydrogenase
MPRTSTAPCAPRAARSTRARGRACARAARGLLLKIADLIEKHGDELAQLETLDNGKSVFESRNVDIPPRRRRSATTPAG